MGKKVIAASAVIAFSLSVVFASGVSHGFSGFTPRKLVRLQLKDFKKDLAVLKAHDLDIAGMDIDRGEVDVIVESHERAGLLANGFKVIEEKGVGGVDTIDSRYQTPASVEARLKAFNAQFPQLTEVTTIGKTLEGRDIWALKISNPAIPAPFGKPVLYFNSMHHAREVMTPEVAIDMAEYLLTRYATDPQAAKWVDSNEIWIIPMVNPDGNNKVWTADNWWRKNASGSNGVDINRNYPFQWNFCDGASDWPSAQDYRGPSAGSELETQAVTAFVSRIKPVFSISFHSYAELVLYPYSCDGQYVPTREVVEPLGQQIAALLPSDKGTGTYRAGTPPDLLYAVDGGDIDWIYHETQAIPYVIEINSTREGFQPSYTQWRDRTVTKLRAAWQLLLNRVDGSGIRGEIRLADGSIPANAIVHVERMGTTSYMQDYRASELGRFHLVLNPGDYRVTVSAPGFNESVQNVTIGSARVDIGVTL